MYPSNLRIGHDDEENEGEREDEKEDVDIKSSEAKTCGSDLASFSPPEPERSRKVEESFTGFEVACSDRGRTLDRSYSWTYKARWGSSTDRPVCVGEGMGLKTTMRGPFEVLVVT